ncbi:MAG: transposase [Candidatus Tectimicrobiota bacterium]
MTSLVTVWLVRLSRGGQVARELLGAPCSGLLVTDRDSAYTWYPGRGRPLCWAHRLRDCIAMRNRGGPSAALGEDFLVQAPQRFTWWHRGRVGTWPRSTFRSYMTPVRRAVERLLVVGSPWAVATTAGTCQALLKQRHALWTFVHVAGVEPTHNAATRALRPGVLWRKGRVGTQSEAGSCCVARMMTVVATLKQQPRHVLASLTAAHAAALRGEAAPALLPALTMASPAVA